jgi:hypothetical protein
LEPYSAPAAPGRPSAHGEFGAVQREFGAVQRPGQERSRRIWSRKARIWSRTAPQRTANLEPYSAQALYIYTAGDPKTAGRPSAHPIAEGVVHGSNATQYSISLHIQQYIGGTAVLHSTDSLQKQFTANRTSTVVHCTAVQQFTAMAVHCIY